MQCNCDYVKYNPVCSEDGKTTFISACHAGCKQIKKFNGTDVYTDCSCVITNRTSNFQRMLKMKKTLIKENVLPSDNGIGGYVTSGNCEVNCFYQFYIFLVVVCILKFSGATGRASNFLVTVR